jgi:DNA repair protein Rad10
MQRKFHIPSYSQVDESRVQRKRPASTDAERPAETMLTTNVDSAVTKTGTVEPVMSNGLGFSNTHPSIPGQSSSNSNGDPHPCIANHPPDTNDDPHTSKSNDHQHPSKSNDDPHPSKSNYPPNASKDPQPSTTIETSNSIQRNTVHPPPTAKNDKTIKVNSNQRGNPLLTFLTGHRYEFIADLGPDYVVGAHQCVLFLSLRYHRLHPEYLYYRLKQATWQASFNLKVLLVQVDVTDHEQTVRELSKWTISQKWTLMMAWSAGKYTFTYDEINTWSIISMIDFCQVFTQTIR